MTELRLNAAHVWSDAAWRAHPALTIRKGRFADSGEISAGIDATARARWLLPGMPNLHSHAFQRAMAGLAEHRAQTDDSFWSWRETMYAFANRIGPEDLQTIATELYVEMLKAGYTHVCEFHYLHGQRDGTPYDDRTTMSLALIAAARDAGIGLTLLPTLYMSGGFDGRALSERQRRFGLDVDAYLDLLQRLRKHESSTLRIGIALHSLRAVPETAMRMVLDSELARDRPIHIHIAEQIGEVQDCLALRNARPVEWLLDHAAVDARWCLVHATHLTDDETQRIAATGAVVGLCPTTEANLGDGLFPLKKYLVAGGAIGLGSDSHISVSPVEELRWLEYGQRLATRHRNIAASTQTRSTGERLLATTLAGGAQASGIAIGRIETDARADLLVLDADSPLLASRDAENVIDTWIFAGNSNLVRDVMVAGEWIVRDGHHPREAAIASRYAAVVERLAREV